MEGEGTPRSAGPSLHPLTPAGRAVGGRPPLLRTDGRAGGEEAGWVVPVASAAPGLAVGGRPGG